jgi:hypothetical protein
MPRQPVLIEGRVTSFNISPTGEVEGILLACGEKTVQVNFEKHAEGQARPSLGASIAVHAVLEEDEHDHPVYRLAPEEQTVHGRVARLNYARHGEVNGYVLEDGTFIHLKPEGARRHRVRVGEEVSAEGTRRVGEAATVIEATSVTRTGGRKRATGARDGAHERT